MGGGGGSWGITSQENFPRTLEPPKKLYKLPTLNDPSALFFLVESLNRLRITGTEPLGCDIEKVILSITGNTMQYMHFIRERTLTCNLTQHYRHLKPYFLLTVRTKLQEPLPVYIIRPSLKHCHNSQPKSRYYGIQSRTVRARNCWVKKGGKTHNLAYFINSKAILGMLTLCPEQD